VFSTLLFITQQSQNWEEGRVLLDDLRSQGIKVFMKDYITLASRLSALVIKTNDEPENVYRNGRKKLLVILNLG
jgi:hypothetical protein